MNLVTLTPITWPTIIGLLGSALVFLLLARVLSARLADRLMVVATALMVIGALLIALVPTVPPTGPTLVLLGAFVLAVAVAGGGPVASFALALATKGSVAPGVHGGILVEHRNPSASPVIGGPIEVLRGGTAIGVLERLALVAALFSGYPEAIAVIVAVKGVGRFTELDSAEARERFIIGSLASLLWAAGVASILLLARG